MGEYSLKMLKYNISKDQYLELKYFCRQYDEKRHQAATLVGASSPDMSGMPKGNTVGRPVESAVIKRERLLHDVQMIEACAREVDDGVWYEALIDNCCRRIPYQGLRPDQMGSSNHGAFWSARRRFFYLLYLRRTQDKGGQA